MKRVFQHPTTAANPTGRTYWRTMGELNDTPDFRDFLSREFPAGAAEMETDGLSRRNFLQLMGASMALAGFGLSGCRRPEAHLVPFTKSAEWQIPGRRLLYATSMPRRVGAMPLVASTTDGRPIKNEGNPLHPASSGASDGFAQASILDLYDPDRSRGLLFGGKPADKAKFTEWIKTLRTEAAADRGASLAFLVGESHSPTRERMRDEVVKQFPGLTWAVYEALQADNERAATEACFGSKTVKVVPRFAKADCILALDCDFLHVEDFGLEPSRDFSSRRRVEKPTDTMNRLYVVENRFTLTGGQSDHRLRCPASQVGAVAMALARAIQTATGNAGVADALGAISTNEAQALEKSLPWINECAKDLVAHNGSALVVVGPYQPAWVHALVFAINGALGSYGKTLAVMQTQARPAESIVTLAEKIKAGTIKTLFISGSNPAYDAPSDLGFAELLKKVPMVVHLGSHVDETAVLAKWHVPVAHFLEAWGDDRSPDGTYVAVQPMILPLHGGISEIELLAHLAGQEAVEGPALVKETFKTQAKNPADEAKAWNDFLRDGFLVGSAALDASSAFASGSAKAFIQANYKAEPAPSDSALEVALIPDYSVHDGRYANNGWLQEMPDPITKLTWDNAALMSMATAKKLKIRTSEQSEGLEGAKTRTKEYQPRDGQGTGVWGDMIEITVDGRKIKAAAMISPGHADNCISIALGYGRTHAGKVGKDKGFNAYPLRTTKAMYFQAGAKAVKTADEAYLLATTQQYFNMEGRALVRELPLETYRANAGFDHENKSFVQKFGMDGHIPPGVSLYPNPPLTASQQWGMSIDLNTCTGCNACVVACQGENNIPIVGKEQVRRGRVMQWIRLDRYYSSENADDADPQVVMQPVTCHHCENAPCETVCPVNATIHTEEGLNAMAYNRCIGTRYCANNCPYKVRRFNYFDYNERPLDKLRLGPFAEKGMAETLKLSKNPNVTVRMRGVMEKCTFCVQRIEEAKIAQLRVAKGSNNTKVPTDTIKTACQQVCPTEAIVFGDISDPESRVSKLKALDRDYKMLEYLFVKPRLSYLARLRNPNMAMPGAKDIGQTSLKDMHHQDKHDEPAKH